MNAAPPIIMTIAEIGAFLLEHGDTIMAIKNALGSGASMADVMHAIQQSMIDASDTAMEQELGPRPGTP